MAIKYTLTDGSIIETDTPAELKETLAVLTQPLAVLTQPNAHCITVSASNTTPQDSHQVPSIKDFQKAIQDKELEPVLRFIANQGSNGTIDDNDVKQNTGKDSLSGMGRIFKKTTGGACWNRFIKKNSIKNRYEVDESAYSNLMQAFNNNP